MTPRRPRPLCAICADREATTATDWELRGVMREVPACEVCLAPVPDPVEAFEPVGLAACVSTRPALAKRGCKDSTLRDAIMAAVRQRGTVTSKELQAEFAMLDDADRCVLAKSLSRMVDRGQLVAAWVDDADHGQGRRFRAAEVQCAPAAIDGTRAAVITTVRRLGGASRRQIVAELAAAGNPSSANLIRKHLRRLESCGAMVLDGDAYRLTDSIATSQATAATAGVFEALPEEFDTYAIDPDRKRAAVIVRAWLQEGLVSCVRAKRDSTVGGQRVWFAALWRKTEQARRAA